MKGFIAAIICVIMAIGIPGFAADGGKFDRTNLYGPGGNRVSFAQNKILVKLSPQARGLLNRALFSQGKTGIPALDAVGQRHGATSTRPLFTRAERTATPARGVDLAGWHKVKFRVDIDVLAVVEEYKALPGVIVAQPAYIYRLDEAPLYPNDPLLLDGSQWHLQENRVNGPGAWSLETGNETIIVAILDSGVRYFHKDLGGPDASYENTGPGFIAGNIWINEAEIPGNQKDDDGNGLKDDWIGWDFVSNAASCDIAFGEDCGEPDNDPRDFHGHGTHCAGNVAAINNNIAWDPPLSVASLAGGWWDDGNSSNPFSPGVKIMPLRVGWSDLFGLAGYIGTEESALAFDYASEKRAHIASCSWGGVLPEDVLLRDAIKNFLDSGGLVFKAAGNDASNVSDAMSDRWGNQGGTWDNLINVAATDKNDCKASFSTYGDWIDIAAPGVAILSTYHHWLEPQNDTLEYMDGTSMATPLAAGVAALIWSQNPDWTAGQVKQKLLDSADDIYGLSCNATYAGQLELGSGRVNAYQAVSAASTGNNPPEAIDDSASVVEDSGANTITLTASDVDGDSLTYTVVNGTANGTLSGPEPTVTYTPDLDFNGSDSFTFRANDGTADSNLATVNITVTPVNDPPVANDIDATTDENAPLTINLTASDVEGDSLTYGVVDGPVNGTLSGTAPTVTYTPDLDFNGGDSFTFKANDGTADSTLATVSITVTPVNDPPIADLVTINLAEYKDKARQLLVEATSSAQPTVILTLSFDDGSLEGFSAVMPYSAADAKYVYRNKTPKPLGDRVTVTSDLAGSDTAFLGGASTTNTPPEANDDTFTAPANSNGNSLDVLGNDSDADGDALGISSVTNPASQGGMVISNPTSDGVLYTPAADFSGPETFTYVVTDGKGGIDSATVTVTVASGRNKAPTAVPDYETTTKNSSAVIHLVKNDSDTDGNIEPATIVIESGPIRGATVEILKGDQEGWVNYAPKKNFVGTDTFTYTVKDNEGTPSNEATVSVIVNR